MTRFRILSLVFIFSICSTAFLSAADETLTITTYYPSPHGSYNELSANKLAIGGAVAPTTAGVLLFTGVAADPSGTNDTQAGAIYYNSTNNSFKYYDGTAWKSLGGAGSAFSNMTMDVFTASANFTVPSGVTAVMVEVRSAGGGGGGGAFFAGDGYFGGGGGGGGAYGKGIVQVTPGTTYTITVGGGGAAGAYMNNGGNGGSSSFGSLISATGGAGGLARQAGGGGGTTTGTLAMSGYNGSAGGWVSSAGDPTGGVAGGVGGVGAYFAGNGGHGNCYVYDGSCPGGSGTGGTGGLVVIYY